jgi:hypothetical protein
MKTLPAGIQQFNKRGSIAYRVRFMLDGARINLGTFVSLDNAFAAMQAFKIADESKHRMSSTAPMPSANSHATGYSFASSLKPSLELAAVHSGQQLDALHSFMMATPATSSETNNAIAEYLASMPSALFTMNVAHTMPDGTVIPASVINAHLHAIYNTLNASIMASPHSR